PGNQSPAAAVQTLSAADDTRFLSERGTMKRLLALALGFGVLALVLPTLTRAAPPDKDKAAAKEALQALQDFVGEWKGSGGPHKAKVGGQDIWKENVNWGWRFKGDDAWLVLEVKDGKYLKGGELRYLPDRKKYQFTAIYPDGKKAVFEGDVKNEVLVVER